MPLYKAFAGPCARLLPELGCSCSELLWLPFATALGFVLPHQGILVWSFLHYWLQLGLQFCFAFWPGTPHLALALFWWLLGFRWAGLILWILWTLRLGALVLAAVLLLPLLKAWGAAAGSWQANHMRVKNKAAENMFKKPCNTNWQNQSCTESRCPSWLCCLSSPAPVKQWKVRELQIGRHFVQTVHLVAFVHGGQALPIAKKMHDIILLTFWLYGVWHGKRDESTNPASLHMHHLWCHSKPAGWGHCLGCGGHMPVVLALPQLPLQGQFFFLELSFSFCLLFPEPLSILNPPEPGPAHGRHFLDPLFCFILWLALLLPQFLQPGPVLGWARGCRLPLPLCRAWPGRSWWWAWGPVIPPIIPPSFPPIFPPFPWGGRSLFPAPSLISTPSLIPPHPSSHLHPSSSFLHPSPLLQASPPHPSPHHLPSHPSSWSGGPFGGLGSLFTHLVLLWLLLLEGGVGLCPCARLQKPVCRLPSPCARQCPQRQCPLLRVCFSKTSLLLWAVKGLHMPNLCVVLMTEDNCCVQGHALLCCSPGPPKQHASFCSMAKGLWKPNHDIKPLPLHKACSQPLHKACSQPLHRAHSLQHIEFQLLLSYFLYNLSLSAKMEALVAPFSLHLGSNSSINALWLIFKNFALAAVQAMMSLRLVPGPSGICWM